MGSSLSIDFYIGIVGQVFANSQPIIQLRTGPRVRSRSVATLIIRLEARTLTSRFSLPLRTVGDPNFSHFTSTGISGEVARARNKHPFKGSSVQVFKSSRADSDGILGQDPFKGSIVQKFNVRFRKRPFQWFQPLNRTVQRFNDRFGGRRGFAVKPEY